MHNEGLSIAGVQFSVRSELPLHADRPDSPYGRFLSGSLRGGSSGSTHSVLLCSEPAPEANDLPVAFSAPTWQLRSDGGVRTIEGLAGREARLLWVCRLAPDFATSRMAVSRHYRQVWSRESGMFSPVRYPLDQVLLMHILARKEGMIVHAAGLDVKGRGIAVAGKSGAGKSTTAELLVRHRVAEAVSDDRIVIRKGADGFGMFGTPWGGKGRIAENRSVPLRALLFLEQAPENALRRIDRTDAVEKLLPVVSVPWFDRDLMPTVLETCERLVDAVPAFVCRFRPNEQASAMIADLVESL